MNEDIAVFTAQQLIEKVDISQWWGDALPPFQYVADCESQDSVAMPLGCGCLTMIRSDAKRILWQSDRCHALTKGKPDEKLTAAIVADDRIPKSVNEIDDDHIPLFAAWQSNIVEYWDGDRDVDNIAPTDEEVRAMAKTIADEVETLERTYAA